MIDPPPDAIIPGSTPRVTRNMLFTFTAISQSHSAAVISRKGFTISVPAWLNSTLAGPSAAVSLATAAITSASSDTSAAANTAPVSAASASPRATSRSMIPTCAPSAMNNRTAAAPQPPAPPVTMAVLPASRPIYASPTAASAAAISACRRFIISPIGGP
jgi:hypothetical protein